MAARDEMISISDFLEPMEHEGLSDTIFLKKEGYRLDPKGRGAETKKGLKCVIECGKFMSVDYLYETDGKAYLVEFSDLWDQHLGIIGRISGIQDSDLSDEDKRYLVEKEKKVIRGELMGKFKDSIHILNVGRTKLSGWSAPLKSGKYRYRVIVKEESLLDGIRDSDLSMFLSQLQMELRCAMKYSDMCVNIKLSPIDIWAESKNY